jgi:hypothetical protein
VNVELTKTRMTGRRRIWASLSIMVNRLKHGLCNLLFGDTLPMVGDKKLSGRPEKAEM